MIRNAPPLAWLGRCCSTATRWSRRTRTSTRADSPMPSVCIRMVNICSAEDAGNRRSLSLIRTRPQPEAANTRRFRNHERPDAWTAAGHGGVIAGPGVRAVGAEVAGRWPRRRHCSGEAQLAAWDRRSSAGRRRVAQVGRADRAPAGRSDAPGHDEPLPQYDPGADGHPPSPRIPRFGDPEGHVVGLVKSA